MNKQISELSVETLKAAAYDNLAQIEQCQNNLKAINQELANRAQAPHQKPISNGEEATNEEIKEILEDKTDK